MVINRKFYSRNTIRVAKDLLGCFLVRKIGKKIIRVKITETESYRGEYDLASHAARGRTPRTEIMYGEAGYAYVYLIYGMYSMLNIVTEEKDFPAAVLIRGGEILSPLGKERPACRQAGLSKGSGICDACETLQIPPSPPFPKEDNLKLDGPGKLTKFLKIDKALNGHDLTRGEKLWLEFPKEKTKTKIIKSPRIGVEYAKHCKNWKWNFKIASTRS